MLPYILLVLISAGGCWIAVSEDKKRKLYIGTSVYIREHNMALPFFFVLLFLLLALRGEAVGNDVENYKHIFRGYAQEELDTLLSLEPEVLFRVLNWGIGRITDNYQVVLAIFAAATLIPIAQVYCEDRRHSYLKMILFVNMVTFIMLFSGIRQSIAMALGMLAYRSVREKKKLKFLVLGLLAFGIHHSGFMVFFMYPLYHTRFKRKHLWLFVPLVVMVFVFNKEIFILLTSVLADFIDKYDAQTTQTGAVTSLILFLLFWGFSWVIPDERKTDREIEGLRNFMLFAVVLQAFAPLHALAMRMNYYYILFIPILIPKVVCASREENRQIAKWGRYVMCTFFTCYFVFSMWRAYEVEGSLLNTVPYVPFWRE